MEYLDIKEWLNNLSYKDLIYLCARNRVSWFPHHDNDKAAILRHLEKLGKGYRFIENLYKNRGLLDWYNSIKEVNNDDKNNL